MKMKSLLAVMMLLLAGLAFAQTDTIPLVTARDINFIPDSTAATWPPSPLAGKTVRVRGTVTLRTRVDPVSDRKPILTYNKALSSYIQGEGNELWSGLNVYQTDSAIAGTAFDLIDTASTYEFTGVVTTYGQGTELILTTTPQPIPVNLISQQMERPKPIPMTLDSFYMADGKSFNNDMRKYYGMYVILKSDLTHPLITTNLITGTSSTAGGFKVEDGNGHRIQMYAQSNYFKTASTYPRLRTNYTPPTNGSYISYIKGILNAYNSPTDGWIWEVVPIYPDDLGDPLLSPPAISNVKRNPGVVAPNTNVLFTATAVGLTGSYVTHVRLMKIVNGGALDSLEMTRGTGADSINYSVTMPGISSDSAYVEYYVKAYDSNLLSSTSPQSANTSKYAFFVLNKPLTIQHVRYSPTGSGYSAYNNYVVTVNGVVVADSSDIPGNHGTNPARVYVANGYGPWSSIVLGTGGALGTQVLKLKTGDNVTLTGTVALGSFGNRIDTLTTLTVNSKGNATPEAHVMKTGDVGTSTLGTLTVEPWNGSLVTYQNVTVDVRNADTSATGTSNFGESYVTDANGGTHTRVIWSDGNTSFNVGASAVKVQKGDRFTSITGILGYTHSSYKLCPRHDADLVGYVSDVREEGVGIATSYKLEQNFPNPFNPATVISYSLPKAANVTVKIYNLLGQEVRTLVSQMQSAGNHQVAFDASSLNSGVYFYSLKADNNFTQVKKMMLVK